eukprot:CAMPEP_0202891544 /NCGR_PEP_ID=MMETSP1392-20130828/1582_1 /ASSEMBLY_ACC=CAM_ASM_000868 /TAXON_ID=225041 /ORGANISM="Chlamydomonas chlamydogama, Strain SAG 11-48b" /LENGTH=157 /DNA_ID=CAMNT_0049575331 /DNA_START=83 /DNA_END=557 /DNA_ORIENTATION=+
MSNVQYRVPLGQGGLLGAVARVKERKRVKVLSEEEAKQKRRNRPGYKDGKPDGTLGATDIADVLARYNNGVPPCDEVVMEIMMQAPTNEYGRVPATEVNTVVALWMSRTQALAAIGPGGSAARGGTQQEVQPIAGPAPLPDMDIHMGMARATTWTYT